MVVRQRRNENTMTKRKKNKRTNNDLQNITKKIKDTSTTKTTDEHMCFRRISNFCTRRATLNHLAATFRV